MTDHESVPLRRIMEALDRTPSASVLDLGTPSQAAIDHLAGPERLLYSEDLLRSLTAAVAAGASAAEFLSRSLAHSPARFDAVLCWETLAFLPDPYLPAVVARIGEILKPGGLALAIFPASPAAARAATGRFEIVGPGVFRRRTVPPPAIEARLLTRREIDRLLGGRFEVTAFVTHDSSQELLLARRRPAPGDGCAA